jgi:hypothetical protein
MACKTTLRQRASSGVSERRTNWDGGFRFFVIGHFPEIACGLNGTVNWPLVASWCDPKTAACRHGVV